MRRLAFPAALLLASLSAVPLAAQDTTDAQPGEWLIGGSVGVPGYSRDAALELFTIGGHATHARPLRVGGDYFVGTMPRLLTGGAIVVGARAGVVVPVALSEYVLLLPSAGGSLIGGFGGGGGGADVGLNVGVAGVGFESETLGVRVGITWHRFRGFDASFWLLEFGLVRRR